MVPLYRMHGGGEASKKKNKMVLVYQSYHVLKRHLYVTTPLPKNENRNCRGRLFLISINFSIINFLSAVGNIFASLNSQLWPSLEDSGLATLF